MIFDIRLAAAFDFGSASRGDITPQRPRKPGRHNERNSQRSIRRMEATMPFASEYKAVKLRRLIIVRGSGSGRLKYTHGSDSR